MRKIQEKPAASGIRHGDLVKVMAGRSKGKTGKVEVCRDKVSEIKVDYGTGYRVYFTEIGRVTAILLGGGTKKGQQADIDTAVKAAKEYHKPPQTKR